MTTIEAAVTTGTGNGCRQVPAESAVSPRHPLPSGPGSGCRTPLHLNHSTYQPKRTIPALLRRAGARAKDWTCIMTPPTYPATCQRPTKLIIGTFAKFIVLGDLADWETRGPQCVSIDPETGRRCTSHVPAPHEAEGTWAECWIPSLEGLLTFFEPGDGSAACYILQLCGPHTKIDAQYAVDPPELVRFDTERHGHLVTRKTAILTPEGQYRASPETGLATCTVEPSRRWRVRAGAKFREEAARLGPRPTALYRYFDGRGRLLYVGITDHIHHREAGHVKASSWMDFAARSTIVRYPTRDEALEAEGAMIRAEQPLFNVVHNDTPEARHRLVEYLIEHGRTDLLAPAVSRG